MHVLFTVGREPTMYNKNGNSYFQFSIKNVRKIILILFPTYEVMCKYITSSGIRINVHDSIFSS